MPQEMRQLRDTGDDLFFEYKMTAESYLEVIELQNIIHDEAER